MHGSIGTASQRVAAIIQRRNDTRGTWPGWVDTKNSNRCRGGLNSSSLRCFTERTRRTSSHAWGLAVLAALTGEFGSIQVQEGYDVSTREIILDFNSGGRDFTVRVSREYDEDYASGQVQEVRQLGSVLRASKDGRVRVKRTGLSRYDPT